MKSIFAILGLIVIISSCQKSNDLSAPATAVTSPAPTVAKPSSSFSVSSPFGTGTIVEGVPLVIDNTSLNADSYYWDFGNGVTSTDKIPANITFVPCGTTATIVLTVKNKAGDVATYTQSINVSCSGKHVGG